MISRADRGLDGPIGSRDQEPWQAAQAARMAATIAAVAKDPDPNAVARALGYEAGGGGLVGLAGTVAGALVDVSKVATPVVAIAAPELLPLVAGITAASKIVQGGARFTQMGASSTPLDMAGAASAARAAIASQIDGDGTPARAAAQLEARAEARAARAEALSPPPPPPRSRLESALRAMPPARAQAALQILLLLRQQGRI